MTDQWTYTNYSNLDAGFLRVYEAGDRLVRGWVGQIEGGLPEAVLERIFARHNQDDRPDGQLCPSMSVGDVVVFGWCRSARSWSGWSVAPFGFAPVTLMAADLIHDRTWREAREEGGDDGTE
jgi:hypothetical protein